MAMEAVEASGAVPVAEAADSDIAQPGLLCRLGRAFHRAHYDLPTQVRHRQR